MRYREQIDKVLKLRNSGKENEIIAILETIYEDVQVDDDNEVILVGLLFKEANELSKALYCFQRAVKFDPMSYSASIGLFHSLWRLERFDDAWNELERFLSISQSEDHSSQLEDLRQSHFGDIVSETIDPLDLIMKLREKFHNDPSIIDKSEPVKQIV